MSNSQVRRKPVALVLVGVLSMLAALFVLSGPATAKSAGVSGASFCLDGNDASPEVNVCDRGENPVPSPSPDKGNESPAGAVNTPTPETVETPTEVPAETPTEVPTETPTEEPTETPTEEPTETPTEVPTETPTEVPTETPTEVPVETPEVAGPEPESPTADDDSEDPEVLGSVVTQDEELAETGVESMMLTIIGVALLAGGAMVSVTGLSLARRRL